MTRPHRNRKQRSGVHRRQVGMGPDVIQSIQAAITQDSAAKGNGNGNNANGNGKETQADQAADQKPAAAKTTPVTTKAPTSQAPSPTQKANTSPPVQPPDTKENPSPKAPTTRAETTTRQQPSPKTTAQHTLPEPVAKTTVTTEAVTSSTKAATTTSSSSARITSSSRTMSRSASISPSASADAAAAGSKGISNGGIAGIVVGLILGIIAVGALAGFLWRKYKSRDYTAKQPWTKMHDDVTPYRDAKRDSDEDFYGGAPIIQHQQQLAFNRSLDSGNAYPSVGHDPTYDAANMAGFGAGGAAASSRAGYGTMYSDSTSHVAASYDQDGRPYSPHHFSNNGYDQGYESGYDQRSFHHQQNPFEEHGSPQTSPQQQNFGGPRQLVGPGQVYGGAVPVPVPAPVPIGRPEAPQSYDEIAAAEMYADDRYADDHLSVPQAAPMPMDQDQSYRDPRLSPSPTHDFGSDVTHPGTSQSIGMDNSLQLQQTDLPTLAPMSPLMHELSLHDSVPSHQMPSPAVAAAAASAQPYDDSLADMYNEVARAAGVHDDASMPYQHGQPLSPLREVPTPKSTFESAQIPDAAVIASPAHHDVRDLPAPSGRPLPSTPGGSNTPAAAPAPGHEDDAYGGI